MKYLVILLLCCATTARAQEAKTFKKPVYPDFYLTPNPYIIDTGAVRKLNDKFYIGSARQDRMPILLPYGTGKRMLNAGNNKENTDQMPNLWNKPQPDSTTRQPHSYKRPLYYEPGPLLSTR
ncbi:hypothetical protein [Niabella sp.]|uniref:hypothetical protein n=1 Tax=Niabella sp. TaxID=1962976 RepID=UPI00261ACED5|nr:hypothetical protein [Niabella sp.]